MTQERDFDKLYAPLHRSILAGNLSGIAQRDKAYEGDACRAKAVECGMRPVVPPKSNRTEPWEYDKELYKGRNVVERNFRRIKLFRRVFTRYDKLDITHNAFIALAHITIFMRNLCQQYLGLIN